MADKKDDVFSIQYNHHMYALFFGLYLSKQEITNVVKDYIDKNPPITEDQMLYVIFNSLRNAPNLTDEALRGMILQLLK